MPPRTPVLSIHSKRHTRDTGPTNEKQRPTSKHAPEAPRRSSPERSAGLYPRVQHRRSSPAGARFPSRTHQNGNPFPCLLSPRRHNPRRCICLFSRPLQPHSYSLFSPFWRTTPTHVRHNTCLRPPKLFSPLVTSDPSLPARAKTRLAGLPMERSEVGWRRSTSNPAPRASSAFVFTLDPYSKKGGITNVHPTHPGS